MWLLLLGVAGCVGDVPEKLGIEPDPKPFGCPVEQGYAVSPDFSDSEREAIEAGVALWNAKPGHERVSLREGDATRCAFTTPFTEGGHRALAGRTLPADYYGAISNADDQRLVLALPCDQGCRARVVYWGISQLAGVQWDHVSCISGGDCPP